MSPRTVLFDLDGTLVDSAAGIAAHLVLALAEVGHPAPDPLTLRALVGPPFEIALPALGLDAPATEAAIAAYRRTYDPVAASVSLPFPGIPELLARLVAGGLRLAVATSKPIAIARLVLDGSDLGAPFRVIGGSDPEHGVHTKADVVGWVLEQLGLDPVVDPVVMVGDRHHDVDGAAAHGVRTIGVAWGYAEPGELAGAGVVVPDVDALATVLLADEVWSPAG